MTEEETTITRSVYCGYCDLELDVQVPLNADDARLSMAAHIEFLNNDPEKMCTYHKQLEQRLLKEGDSFNWADFVSRFPFLIKEEYEQRKKSNKSNRLLLVSGIVILLFTLVYLFAIS